MIHKDHARQMQLVRPQGPGGSGSGFGEEEVQLPDPSAETSLALLLVHEPEQMTSPPAAVQGSQEQGGNKPRGALTESPQVF